MTAARESSAMRRAAERVVALEADVARPGETDAAPEDMAAEQQRLFLAYAEAARRAQGTLKPADGHAAGQAWRAFLGAYAPVPAPKPGILPNPIREGAW